MHDEWALPELVENWQRVQREMRHDHRVLSMAAQPRLRGVTQREQVFETMALACGKINPTAGACKAVRKNS